MKKKICLKSTDWNSLDAARYIKNNFLWNHYNLYTKITIWQKIINSMTIWVFLEFSLNRQKIFSPLISWYRGTVFHITIPLYSTKSELRFGAGSNLIRVCWRFPMLRTFDYSQKQPADMLYKKGVLKNSTKFIRKHMHWSLFFNKVVGLRPATLLKKRLERRHIPVNFVKFFRTPFLQNTSRRLLINSLGCK